MSRPIATTAPTATPNEDLSARLRLLGLPQPAEVRSGLLERIRAIVPKRSLAWREAEQIAERQANRLRSELGVLGPVIHEDDIAALPFIQITRSESFPTSGLLTKTDYGWVVILKGEEPRVRQRFSLAHELKHLLDDPLLDQPAGSLYPETDGFTAHERAERVCDRFAGALLMPRVLVRSDWADGIQDIARLARRYDVSRSAMRVRLSQLGLIEATPRCRTPDALGLHAQGAAA